jgi:A-factor biosynthesis hotdog domain
MDNSRTHSVNQVCANLRQDHRGAHARLLIDQSHPFFFDHPLDHVPGLLLIEAMNQLAEREAYRAADGSDEGALYAICAEVAFTKFCVFGLEASIVAEPQSSNATQIRTRIQQGDAINCKGGFEFEPYPISASGVRAKDRFHKADRSSPAPCPKELLNKLDEANVMIDMPVRIGSTMNANVLPPHPRNMLADNRFGLLPALYLLEAYMQTQRYLNKVFLRQSETVRMRDTLCGVSIRLARPIGREERVRIERTFADNGAPKTGLRLHQGTLHVGKEFLGECSIKTLTVI